MKFISLIRFTMTLCFVLAFGAGQALAQVSVRSGSHDGYSRLVFDWDNQASYEISKSEGTLTVTFDTVGNPDVSKINNANLKNIGNVSVTSAQGSPLSLSIKIVPESDFRHFKIGKRVVIDVYDAPGEPSRTASSMQPSVETPQVSQSPPSETELQSSSEKDGVENRMLGGDQPHVIVLSATQAVGMAAFEREGFLWLVFDNPGLKVPPVLQGPKKDSFGKLEKIELQNAVAYRIQKPEGYNLYGEGGGLLWRLVMTPNPRRVTPARPQIQNTGLDPYAGGDLFWPVQGVRKIISVTDPLVGDEIKVATVSDASQFTGPDKRQYVELETLPSFIGFAFVPKADDIMVEPKSAGVTVTRPQGLALSPERDTAPVVLKDDIQRERELFADEKKPQALTRIFDFDRWEMGGTQALERNRRVLMSGLGNKEGAAKVEDLITLAKLNISNNRGQEALGLLRIAEAELPGIEENAEFIALRGAAAALAGKYDEAIEEFVKPSLKDYGEINYWKAFTLAGLEDWQQADQVMPANLTLLEEYPLQIKQPVALAMVETALRAGKTDIARNLLNMLQPEYENMALARQARWKYLNGELERQTGNPEDALEEWEPLLTGKDDYFRAKAGLSVTKMQLARQKITPEKAIDRLEGLRYAWRGDELETLINYRLGEVYIDNEEYLKGLSILRNAVSLSPETKITDEVTNYMTDTFRSLFTEGKLKDVSPLDAVSIYDEFKELTPIGREGDVFVQELAERLVDVDLLGRAAALLEHQLIHRLEGTDKIKVALRLASIQLLDNKPEAALNSLDIANNALGAAGEGYEDQKRESRLLRARALSKSGEAREALSLLSNMPEDSDVIRLKADIAWNAGLWDRAAEAFDKLIEEENISKTRPMDEYQTNLVLNRAIALNLSGNRVALDSLRTEYNDLMAQSEKARLFELVTRPRQLGLLGNRESVDSLISEVDLFGDFLKNYREIN
jgi:predicted negative regulator of RcsB-dependent stress response